MNFRKATVSDISEVKSLWQAVFFDSEEFVNQFIAHFGIEHCFICEINCEVIAMAFALPVPLTSNLIPHASHLKYIYACATHPNYRRQGIMEKLLAAIYDEACAENIAGIFLSAADQKLGDYYRKLGFQDYFYQNCLKFNRKGRKGGAKDAKEAYLIPHTSYLKKRLQKLEGYCFVNWNEDFFRFLAETGAQFCELEGTIFSFKTEEEKIIVDELLCDQPNLKIINLIIKFFSDYNSIEIRMPGNEICCGQVKWCNTLDMSDGYFAFAME
jgi:N-acetylglutamate synthase-like GNAT family acetyltransferase